jgi:hypothetical protein
MEIEMSWEVRIPKAVTKQAKKLPHEMQLTSVVLLGDLKRNGPFPGQRWKNYSKLSKTRHHCHLSHKWVACWEVPESQIKIMEVYYVGSRENAPY